MNFRSPVTIALTLALIGCSTATPPWEEKRERAPPPEYFDAPPSQIPDAKAIIERESATFFDATANAKNIAISGVHPVETAVGVRPGVCLRASLTNRSGKDMGDVYYVVVFDRAQIFDREKAGAKDACGSEKYDTPLTFRPAVKAEPSKETRSKNKQPATKPAAG